MRKIISILLFLLVVSFIPSLTNAVTRYVDYDHASASDSGPGTSESAPWKTPWYASTHVSSGDLVYIKQRSNPSNTYNNGNNVVIEGGVANVTWKAYTGHTVRLSITSTWGNCSSSVPIFSIVVSFSAQNVTIDGFYIWGQVHFDEAADNCTLQNCDISGGVGARDDFISPIYIHGVSGNNATGNRIYNNKIHDNCTNLSTSNNYCNGKASDQCPLVMTYYEENTIYENNEFYNSIGPGIRHKGYPLNVTARYNFFHNISTSFGALMGTDGDPSGPYNYYQNVFNLNGGPAFAVKSISIGNYNIYNNSLYNSHAVDYWIGWQKVNYFNNIMHMTQASTHAAYCQNNYTSSSFTYDNYNCYYATGAGSYSWAFANGTSTSLSAWRSRTGLDGNSITSNPGFLNASGTFSQSADFKRSSYPANGRGGSWPSVMGAYITGNEIIGVSGNLPPSAPRDLRIQ